LVFLGVCKTNCCSDGVATRPKHCICAVICTRDTHGERV
jgi:hypothetical protein